MHAPPNGAEILLECLIRHGVEVVFAYPGGATLPLHQALTRVAPRLRTILPRHEQGGGFAATGYARSTGKVGVCFATSGPGATNFVTCLADAHRHAVPMLAVTGQVARPVLGTDAFQEIPIVSLCRSITKHHYLVTRIEDLCRTVREALHVATTGRPGPVLVDVPKDIQARRIVPDHDTPLRFLGYRPEPWTSPEDAAPVLPPLEDTGAFDAEGVLRRLWRTVHARGRLDDTILTTGSGPEQQWLAQSYRFPTRGHWIKSDSLGAIGFALAAGLGVQAAHPAKTVIAVDTPDSLVANVQELACAFVEKLPVKVLLLSLGGDQHPDFVAIARGFRVAGAAVDQMAELDAALASWLDQSGPALLDVRMPTQPTNDDSGRMLRRSVANRE